MKAGQKLWTKDELVLAINLYCKIPFGRMHRSNPDVIRLAKIIGRSPNAVAWKLVNLASFDPQLQQRGIRGASNASNLDREVWDEFYKNWDKAFAKSERLLAQTQGKTIPTLYDLGKKELLQTGKERERLVKIRVNQYVFRLLVMSNFNNTCCITGIDQPELLIASHIVPWSKDEKNRLNPRNGLALNALHDRAFELGFITITEDYKIRVSSVLKKKKNKSVEKNFVQYENKEIILPDKFKPDVLFLKEHHKRFVK